MSSKAYKYGNIQLQSLSTRWYLLCFLPTSWGIRFHGFTEQSGALGNTVLVPCCPPAWKEKAGRMQHNWARSQCGVRSAAGLWLPAQSPAWTHELEMLLGPHSASGTLSRNEPASEPRSDKMEPGPWPALGSWSTTPTPKTPQTQDDVWQVGWLQAPCICINPISRELTGGSTDFRTILCANTQSQL